MRETRQFDRVLEDVNKLDLIYDARVTKSLNLLRIEWDKDIADYLRSYIDTKKYNRLINNEIFLVPSPEQIAGDIEQGKCNGFIYKTPLKLSPMGKLILGSIGTGKTTDAYLDVIQLRKRNIPVVIFDFRDDYSPLSNYVDGAFIHTNNLRINPVKTPEGISRDTWRNFWTGIICDVLNLHEASLLLLRDNAIEVETRNPDYTLFDLMKHLESKQKWASGMMRQKYDTLNTKIRGFINGMGEILDCKSSMSVDEIFNYGLVVINMVGLSIIEKKFIFYYLLGTKILQSIATRQRGGELRVVVVVDEAEQYLSINAVRATGKIPEIITLINFCRDAGIGQIYIAHNISKLIDEVKQFAIIKAFRTQSLEDINETANVMSIPWDKRGFLAALKERECLISTAMFPQSVLLKSLDFIIDNKVNESYLKASREKFLEKVKYIPRVNSTENLPRADLKESSVKSDNSALNPDTNFNSLSAEQIAFLMDIRNKPHKKVKQRYKDLSLSIDKGTKIKSRLIGDSFLKETELDTYKRGGIFRILSLTKKSYDCLKIPASKNGRGGPEHQYWVGRISNSYAGHYNVKTEYCISDEGKCIDVYAWNEHERIGIELTLSPSPAHEVENIEKCLSFNCTKVVAVSKDNETMEKIKRLASQKFEEKDVGKIEFKLVREFR